MRRIVLGKVTAACMILASSFSTLAEDKAPSQPSSELDIVFPNKMFVNTQAYVSVQGTLTADWLAYRNNTYSILCVPNQCLVASVQQIGPRQIGAIDGPIVYSVTRWSDDEIIAQEDDLCTRDTITIDRKAQTLLWVWIPINQATDVCKTFQPIKPRSATIEPSLFWKPSK
jgi:hypothetical protein